MIRGIKIGQEHISTYWLRDGSVLDTSVSHRDGVAGCTTPSSESKEISGGRICLHGPCETLDFKLIGVWGEGEGTLDVTLKEKYKKG